MSNYLDTITFGDYEYATCGHEFCDLGVDDTDHVRCSGQYCADLGDWLPPDEVYFNDEEAYPR